MTAHLLDDALRRYNLNTLHSEEQEFVRRHVDACPKCGARADLLFEEQLRDPAMWCEMQTVRAEAPEHLLELPQRLAREDATARNLLKDLIAAPTVAYEFIWSNPASHASYRTGGVIRLLTELAHSWCNREPLQALQLAEDAVQIAESLPQNYYPANLIYLYRGDAWKECANAQHFLARYKPALESLIRAERAYRELTFPDPHLASVNLIRATVLAKTKKFDAALAAISTAEKTFAASGDYARYRDACIVEANIHDAAGDPAAARSIMEPLYSDAADLDPHARAVMANNLANFSLELGDTGAARMYLLTALQLFEALGLVDEERFTRWNIAYLALMGGKSLDAARRLRELIREFDTRGMPYEAGLVKVDLLAALLVAGSLKEATRMASDIFRSLQDADAPTGAVTAAVYLKEALRRRALTPDKVYAVRRYLHQLRDDPELLFREPE